MGRSHGFGSTTTYSFALFRLAFAAAPSLRLNLACNRNSPVHSTKARHHSLTSFDLCRHTVSGSISPLPGAFTFPHGTGSLSVTREYLALRDGPRDSDGISCSAVLRILLGVVSISSTGLSPSLAEFSKSFNYTNRLPYWSPTTPTSKLVGLLFRFARRYSGNRIFFLFLQVLRCFSSLRLPLISYVFTEK